MLLAICMQCYPQDDVPVRGVWVTNVDSDVLLSRENIIGAVRRCSELGFNTIAMVVWNKGVTMYPSKTMQQYFGILIDSLYMSRDPLKEMIEEAHKLNIRVIAWFEFGFSASFNKNGGHLIEKYPSWKAIDTAGNLVKKNGFEWLNGFNPDVQDFMLQLITEVSRDYEVDGIQGDDRLPAMPSESGYDPYTVSLYKSQHHDAPPPRNCKDSSWIQWRADILNEYMHKIYTTVKATNPKVEVAMSPSIYPWSKDEYLQDWPLWVRNGWVDKVIPQVYRYSFEEYKKAIAQLGGNELSRVQLQKCIPGILLKVGSYYAPVVLLEQCIDENRKAGYTGEFFFFYEGIKKYEAFFKQKYMTKE